MRAGVLHINPGFDDRIARLWVESNENKKGGYVYARGAIWTA